MHTHVTGRVSPVSLFIIQLKEIKEHVICQQPKLTVNKTSGLFFLLLCARYSHLLQTEIYTRYQDMQTQPASSNWEYGLKLLNWISVKLCVGEQLQ